GFQSAGAGISLDQALSGNLIEDASFEPLVFRQALTIYSGDETTLTVSSQEAGQGLYGDGFFNQASARVMTLSENGLVLKKTARVQHYGINRVGVFQPVILPGDMPDELAFLDFTSQDDVSVGVGEQGLIVRNLTGQATEVMDSRTTADLTGVTANEQLFAACSAAGELVLSEDGETWTILPTPDQQPLSAVAVSDRSVIVAVGASGRMVVGFSGVVSVLSPVTQADLTDIAYGSGTFVAIGRRGVLLTSTNGLIWRQNDLDEQDDWQAIDFRDGHFVLLSRTGKIYASADAARFTALAPVTGTLCRDIVMLSRQQMVVLDEAGEFLISNDTGQSWQLSGIETGMHSRVIDLAGKDKILSAGSDGQLGLAGLVAEIQLDSALRSGQYMAGDLIFLEKISPDVPEQGLIQPVDPESCVSPWILYGAGRTERIQDEAAPSGGQACLRLQSAGRSDQPAILSQAIDTRLLTSSLNEVLQVSLWLRQQDVADRTVQVWLSGPFGPVGTAFTNVGSAWKKFTYALVVPGRPGGYAGQEIRLNISAADGTVWADSVFLGHIDQSQDLLDRSLQEQVLSIRPSVIRLDILGLGSKNRLSGGWAQPMHADNPILDGTCWVSQRNASLHAALELTRASSASPWLVIDSYASEGDLLNLLAYLAAPISEPFGKLRQEQGMVMPWVQSFERVYLEICDRQEVFSQDRLKSEYVNLVIRTISQSPYYRQIKSKLVFVDGMQYGDGVMLSRADYHASDLDGVVRDNRLALSELTVQAYLDQIPRNPEKPAADFPELIRALRLSDSAMQPLRLAELVDVALFDIGQQSGLVNLARPQTEDSRQLAIWQAGASVVSQAVLGSPLQIRPVQPDDTDTTDPRAAVRLYGFSDSRQVTLVLTNLSDLAATCQLISEIDLAGAAMTTYDEHGQLLGQQRLRRSGSKISLLPGGVVLLTLSRPGGQP
ncbi:MAG: hypothetical protein GX112_01700, partial [Clostridiaceae bacterium]|nr:hypothetical protein [Clostridiaceae bacterium]